MLSRYRAAVSRRVPGNRSRPVDRTVSRATTVPEIRCSDEFPAQYATSRILDTPARGLIHLHSIAHPNVAAFLAAVDSSSRHPASQAADDDPRSAHLVRLYAVPAGRVASIR